METLAFGLCAGLVGHLIFSIVNYKDFKNLTDQGFYIQEKILTDQLKSGEVKGERFFRVTSYEKLHEFSLMPQYKLVLDDMSEMKIKVHPLAEKDLLKSLLQNELILEVLNNDKSEFVYPHRKLWSALNRAHRANVLGYYAYNKKLMSEAASEIQSNNAYALIRSKINARSIGIFEFALASMILIPIFVPIHKRIKKRRELFLSHFHESHLQDAQTCIIRLHRNNLGGIGKIYSVKGKNDEFVILNGTNKKEESGYILNYSGESFFIPKNLVKSKRSLGQSA